MQDLNIYSLRSEGKASVGRKLKCLNVQKTINQKTKKSERKFNEKTIIKSLH